MLVFLRTQLARQFVENAVYEFVPIGAPEAASQFYRFVEYHPVGCFRKMFELTGAHQEYAPLYGRHLFPGPVEERSEHFLQGAGIVQNSGQQRFIEVSVDFVEAGHPDRLGQDGGLVLAADQGLIEPLQDELPSPVPRIARLLSGRLEGQRRDHRRKALRRLAISMAAWAASLPFWAMRASA